MSTSLRQTMGFYFPNEICEKLFIKERLDLIYEMDELDVKGLANSIAAQIKIMLNLGVISQAEIDDVNFSFFDLLQNKKSGKSLYEFISTADHFDNTEGIYFTSAFDNINMRYKHNVDWYPNVVDMMFNAQKAITTLHCGKPCLVKGSVGKLDVFYEEDLKKAYNTLTGLSATDLNRVEFYDFMMKNGFSQYVSPLYFMFAKAANILKDDVSKKDFDTLGSFSVLTIWR